MTTKKGIRIIRHLMPDRTLVERSALHDERWDLARVKQEKAERGFREATDRVRFGPVDRGDAYLQMFGTLGELDDYRKDLEGRRGVLTGIKG